MHKRLNWLCLVLLAAPLACAAAPSGQDYAARVAQVLKKTPLIDGHNDLPWEIRERFKSKVSAVDLSADTSALPVPDGGVALMTDIGRAAPRRRGRAVLVGVRAGGDAVGRRPCRRRSSRSTSCARWPSAIPTDFELAYTAADVRRIHKAGRIASLIGIEGGHQIDNSLPVLREMYALGARYMTLTHSANNDWADSATDAPKHHGLTPFGREVVREMNRLGMLVDLSHVSAETMRRGAAIPRRPR